ncbi:alanine racemase [Nevskia ramosa]|uniref:alanine racemase n=1 Tax=Nevskia ramosa TaxID=64002 RepID=UPI002357F841|nr:alanine racemase [Nevskia ramosa]
MPLPRVTATVDLSAVRHNLQRVREFAPQSKVMAAIKADAYGHGAVPVARALAEAGVDAFAVACLEEAVTLRDAGIATRIALLEGVLSAEEAEEAARLELEIVIHDRWQLELLASLPPTTALRVWFKLDSGMHRLGFPLAEAPALQAALLARPNWRLQGWITHLACADDRDSAMTSAQIAAFDAAMADIPGARSIANSAGLIAWPQARVDWVRPGLMLYGASPMPGTVGSDLGLKPAMTVASRLIAVHEVPAGDSVGYGATFICPEAMRVGVVAVGYADGVHRILPTGAPVLIHEQRVPIIGRVSMDMITVDLRSLPQAAVGDAVTLWGPGLPAEEVATWAGTLSYELFCGLTNRVHYRYV